MFTSSITIVSYPKTWGTYNNINLLYIVPPVDDEDPGEDIRSQNEDSEFDDDVDFDYEDDGEVPLGDADNDAEL